MTWDLLHTDLLVLSRSSLDCSSSLMYFCRWSLTALVCPRSSSRVEMCLKASECWTSNFSCKQHTDINLIGIGNAIFGLSLQINRCSCQHILIVHFSFRWDKKKKTLYVSPITFGQSAVFFLAQSCIHFFYSCSLPHGELNKNSSQLPHSWAAIFLVAVAMLCWIWVG